MDGGGGWVLVVALTVLAGGAVGYPAPVGHRHRFGRVADRRSGHVTLAILLVAFGTLFAAGVPWCSR